MAEASSPAAFVNFRRASRTLDGLTADLTRPDIRADTYQISNTAVNTFSLVGPGLRSRLLSTRFRLPGTIIMTIIVLLDLL